MVMPLWCAAYCCDTEETKGLEIPVSYNNTEKISGAYLGIEFHHEPHTVGESTSGSIIWVILNRPFFYVTNRNRNRIRAVLEQGLKETSILNPSNLGLIPLDITTCCVINFISCFLCQQSFP